jgi:Uma2 family endonuclease
MRVFLTIFSPIGHIAMDTLAELELLDDEVIPKNGTHIDDDAEGTLYYQERGKSMPSINHSIVQMRIGALLLRDERYTVASELALNLNGWKSTPDIVVYPYRTIDWLHDEVRSTEPPLLTVEIVSPSQNVTNLVEKAEQYLANGVQSAWVVQPALRLISILTKGVQPITYTSGTLTDPALGITLQMEEIFR